jgi:hypothetical protein
VVQLYLDDVHDAWNVYVVPGDGTARVSEQARSLFVLRYAPRAVPWDTGPLVNGQL